MQNKLNKVLTIVCRAAKQACVRVIRDIRAKRWRGIAAVLVALGAYWLWGTGPAILWLVFMAFLLYGWENRIIGALAILCLVACPILLSLGKNNIAEQFAVYAYYFLVMTVVLQIVEYRRVQKSV